jgi:hypothetical protein
VYDELASVREPVDLSPQDALEKAQGFLIARGYTIVQRTDTSVTVNRRKREGIFKHSLPNLKVVVEPQPQGGVLIRVRGSDREGVLKWQALWTAWAEHLPKREPERPEVRTAHEAPEGEQTEDLTSMAAGEITAGNARLRLASQLQNWSERTEEVESENQRLRELVRTRNVGRPSESATDDAPTRRQRERLLTDVGKLREGRLLDFRAQVYYLLRRTTNDSAPRQLRLRSYRWLSIRPFAEASARCF